MLRKKLQRGQQRWGGQSQGVVVVVGAVVEWWRWWWRRRLEEKLLRFHGGMGMKTMKVWHVGEVAIGLFSFVLYWGIWRFGWLRFLSGNEEEEREEVHGACFGLIDA